MWACVCLGARDTPLSKKVAMAQLEVLVLGTGSANGPLFTLHVVARSPETHRGLVHVPGRRSALGGDVACEIATGFMLHSGQSFPGTPDWRGSRTGTGPLFGLWQVSECAASSPSGRCPQLPRTSFAPAQCSE